MGGRRGTNLCLATNPPPTAATPISKPSMWISFVARPTQLAGREFPPQIARPMCSGSVRAARGRETTGNIRCMARLATATAVVLGLLSARPPVQVCAQSLRVPYQTFTLPNGLQVIVHEDHSEAVGEGERDRKSTRLNSSHSQISYAV